MPTLQDSNQSLSSHEQSCQGSPEVLWGFAGVHPVDKPCGRTDSDAELKRLTHVTCIRGRALPAPVPDSLSENCGCVALAACIPMEWLRFALCALPLHRSCHGSRLCCRNKALLEQVAGWDGLMLFVTHLATCCC